MSQQRQDVVGAKDDLGCRTPANVVPRRSEPQIQRKEGEKKREVGEGAGEARLPPRLAHRLPARPDGGRAVMAFDIPRHEEGSSRVFSRMREGSRGRLNTGTGKTFDAYSANISRFIHRCGLVAGEHGLEFDGDVDTVAYVVAKHGKEVYQPVIDAMRKIENSSPKSQVTCIDAFVYMCKWLKLNMGTTEEAVKLIVLIDQVSVRQAQEDRAEASRLHRQRQSQVTVESMQEDDRWITQERLNRLGNEAYALATDLGARIAGDAREGKVIKPRFISKAVSAVVATVVVGAHTSRQGPMSQLSAADMEKVLAAAEGARFAISGQHKNSRHEETATISMDLNDPKVQEVLRLYRDVLRPLLVEAGRSNPKNAGADSADVTRHFWINGSNKAMNFGKVFSRFVEWATRGEARDGRSGLRIGTTAVRRTIATTVEQSRRQGKLSSHEADLVHRADGHSQATAVKFYAIGAQNEEQAAAGAVLAKLGLTLDSDPAGKGKGKRKGKWQGKGKGKGKATAPAALVPSPAMDPAMDPMVSPDKDDEQVNDDDDGSPPPLIGGESSGFLDDVLGPYMSQDHEDYDDDEDEHENELGPEDPEDTNQEERGLPPRPVVAAPAAPPVPLPRHAPVPVRSPYWKGKRQTHDVLTPTFWEQMAYDRKDPASPHWVKENGGRVPLGDGSGGFKEKWYKGAGRSNPPSPPLPLPKPDQKRMAYTNEESYLVRRWKEDNEHKHPSPQDLWDALETKLLKAKRSGNTSDPWNRAFGPTHREANKLKDHAARGMKDFDWGGTRTEEGRTGKRRQQQQQERETQAAAGTEAGDQRERQGSKKRPREDEASPEGRAAAGTPPVQAGARQKNAQA